MTNGQVRNRFYEIRKIRFMKITSINIKNFKGIESKKFQFNPYFTVLVGDNASGKSSILDAISISLGTVLMRTQASFGINGRKTRPLFKEEIRKVMISPDNIEYTDVELSGQFTHNNKTLNWKRTQLKTSKSLSYRDAKDLIDLGIHFSEKVEDNINLPLMVYHSTARLAGEIYGKTNYEKIGSRFDGYYACLDPRSIKQKFISWFKTFEDSALKFNKDKSLYNAYTETLKLIIKDWHDVKFHWGLDDMVGKTSDGTWLPLSNLSDGYRSVVRLASDIAYRAIKLNPHLGINAVKETEGIVLIDELDMHLHPTWQQRIVTDLKLAFPKIQFIVTTHSPFIVQSLKSNEIINLDGKSIDEHPDTMSIEQNAIFMGVQSKNSKLFDEKEKAAFDYLNILKKGVVNESDIQKLDELIETSSDPVFKAKLKLERLAKLGSK